MSASSLKTLFAYFKLNFIRSLGYLLYDATVKLVSFIYHCKCMLWSINDWTHPAIQRVNVKYASVGSLVSIFWPSLPIQFYFTHFSII